MNGPYDDILYHPYKGSNSPKRMSMTDRGAQFSPFAALTGYDAAIRETGRLTDRQAELDGDEKAALDEKLRYLAACRQQAPRITVTYFLPDLRKEGGSYEMLTGEVRKVDVHRQALVMKDGTVIFFSSIRQLQGEVFQKIEGLSLGEE